MSFIIPTLNEEIHIGGVLDSVRENVAGRYQYEVIIVDNGSVDRTVEIAEKKGALCLQALECSISSLRNLGVSIASYNIFVFLDGDVYLGRDWGEQIGPILERLSSNPDIITGSFYGISKENNWIERVWFAPRTTLSEVNYINGGHLIIHRDLFSRVGGFAPDMRTGEDYEFCTRARKVGARIENVPDLKVIHAGYPKSIKRFFTRERWHGSGDYNSFVTLLSSKPALICLANLCLALICLVGMFFYVRLWFVFLSVYCFFIFGISVAAAVNKSHSKINTDLLRIAFLYIIYFTARTMSLVDAVIGPLVKQTYKTKKLL